jgi:hypothetical protein
MPTRDDRTVCIRIMAWRPNLAEVTAARKNAPIGVNYPQLTVINRLKPDGVDTPTSAPRRVARSLTLWSSTCCRSASKVNEVLTVLPSTLVP